MFFIFLEWLVKERLGFKIIYYYLDDFIFIGSVNIS